MPLKNLYRALSPTAKISSILQKIFTKAKKVKIVCERFHLIMATKTRYP